MCFSLSDVNEELDLIISDKQSASDDGEIFDDFTRQFQLLLFFALSHAYVLEYNVSVAMFQTFYFSVSHL